MPSPFPGMDPYVESRWNSFHGLFLGAVTSLLNGSLPDDLEARLEEQVRVEDLAGEQLRGFAPDIGIIDHGATAKAASAAEAAAVAEPIRLRRRRGPITVRHVEIVDWHDGGRVVTAIELLSPWNKLSGRLNRDYRRKLRDFERGGTSWVELDLLRSPRSRLPVRWDAVPAGRRSNYLVVVYRAPEDDLSAIPISVRQRLPVIGVPLREGEADLPLDLQSGFDRAFTDGPFKRIDYARPPDPPLSEADAIWAAELLRQPR